MEILRHWASLYWIMYPAKLHVLSHLRYTLIPTDHCLTKCHTHRARTRMPTETWIASDLLFNSLSTWQNTGSQSCPHISGSTHMQLFVPLAEMPRSKVVKLCLLLSLTLSLVGSLIMMNITMLMIVLSHLSCGVLNVCSWDKYMPQPLRHGECHPPQKWHY